MLILPDTPRWYYSKNKLEQGDEVLSRLFDQPIESEVVQQQRQEILDNIKLESQGGHIRLSDWFWDRSQLQNARRIRTSFLILTFQQLMGEEMTSEEELCLQRKLMALTRNQHSGLLLHHSPGQRRPLALPTTTPRRSPEHNFRHRYLVHALLHRAMGTEEDDVLDCNRLCVTTIHLHDRADEFSGTVCMAVFIAMQGLSNKTTATQWTAVAFIIVFIFQIGFGWMGCPWLVSGSAGTLSGKQANDRRQYGPEISPLKYRSQGAAAGTVGEWSMTFITCVNYLCFVVSDCEDWLTCTSLVQRFWRWHRAALSRI